MYHRACASSWMFAVCMRHVVLLVEATCGGLHEIKWIAQADQSLLMHMPDHPLSHGAAHTYINSHWSERGYPVYFAAVHFDGYINKCPTFTLSCNKETENKQHELGVVEILEYVWPASSIATADIQVLCVLAIWPIFRHLCKEYLKPSSSVICHCESLL